MTRKGPLVSVLIPTFNRADLVGKTIESALSQTISDIEVIVCDNCSTDNSVEVIEAFARQDNRVRLIVNETNIGPTRNWKRCIDKARGKYAKIIFSDDWISLTFLEKTLPFLVENDSVGFVFTNAIVHDLTLKPLSGIYGENNSKTGIYPITQFLQYHLYGGNWVMPVGPGRALFRLDDLRNYIVTDIPNTLGLRPSCNGAGPDLLCFLSSAHDYTRFAYVNDYLCHLRAHQGSFTMKEDLWLYYRLAVCHFVKGYFSMTDVQRRCFYTQLLWQLCRRGMWRYFEPLTGQKISVTNIDLGMVLRKVIKRAVIKLGRL